MNPTIDILFRNMEPSPAITTRVREEFEKLSQHHADLVRCRATIGAPHRHHLHGHHFQVRLEIGLQGHAVVVDHEPAARLAVRQKDGAMTKHDEVDVRHKDVYVAIRDTFDVARRKLDEVRRRRRAGQRTKVRIAG